MLVYSSMDIYSTQGFFAVLFSIISLAMDNLTDIDADENYQYAKADDMVCYMMHYSYRL